LSCLSVEVFTTSSDKFQPILPAVLMAVPIFDTLVAMVRRRLRKHSLSRPDREHIHHRLMERPFTTHQVLLTIASLCVSCAAGMFAGWWFQSELLRPHRKVKATQTLSSIGKEHSEPDLALFPLPSDRLDRQTQKQTDRERRAA